MTEQLKSKDMTHEQFVTAETAELAKQAGFDWGVQNFYKEGDDTLYTPAIIAMADYNWNILDNIYSAPTQAVLQRWFREVKNVVILVDFDEDEDCEENERYGVDVFIRNKRILELTTYPTYEEALETGSQICLKYIIHN
jgi:transposase